MMVNLINLSAMKQTIFAVKLRRKKIGMAFSKLIALFPPTITILENTEYWFLEISRRK